MNILDTKNFQIYNFLWFKSYRHSKALSKPAVPQVKLSNYMSIIKVFM